MSSDYYDYHPVRVPQIPISLIGFLGALQETVGSLVSQWSGLHFVDLDRAVEHEVGSSVAQLVMQEGEARYREVEALCLERAIRQGPPGILALGEGALEEPISRERVLQNTALVYLHHEVDDLLDRVRTKRVTHPAAYYPWIQEEPFCAGSFGDALAARLENYDLAPLRISASGRSPESVAQEILEHFQLEPTPGSS